MFYTLKTVELLRYSEWNFPELDAMKNLLKCSCFRFFDSTSLHSK